MGADGFWNHQETAKPVISELKVIKGGQSVAFKWQDEYVGSSYRQKERETVDGELLFVGHGINAPDYNWNDFKNVDVRGKILVLFTNEPQPDNPEVFKGKTLTYYGRWIYKYEEAARKGALGVVIIHTPATAGYGWQVVRNSWSKEDPQVQIASGQQALALAEGSPPQTTA